MVTGDGRVTSDQVSLVGMVAQVRSDERAERDELEPTGPEILQGAGDQPLAQTLALEGGVDLGMDQDHHPWLGPVLDQPGAGRSQPELVARRLRVVGDTGFCRHGHHLDGPVSGYRSSGWPALAQEPLQAGRLSVQVRSGKRLATPAGACAWCDSADCGHHIYLLRNEPVI